MSKIDSRGSQRVSPVLKRPADACSLPRLRSAHLGGRGLGPRTWVLCVLEPGSLRGEMPTEAWEDLWFQDISQTLGCEHTRQRDHEIVSRSVSQN